MTIKSKLSTSRAVGTLTTSLLFALSYFGCGNVNLTGGGSDTEVSGRIMAATGVGVSGTIVTLIDTGYDPGFDGPLASNLFDTTDSQGNYHFDSLSAGTYNVWAFRPVDGTQAFVHNIAVISHKETPVDDRMLSAAAYLRIPLPDSLQSAAGYVYMPGTFSVVLSIAGATSVRFDSLAQGTYSSVVYQRSAADPAIVLFTNVVIDSAGPFILDPFMNWQHEALVSFNTAATGANISESLFGFPALIRLTSAEIDFSQARPEGEDLRFARTDNSLIPFEIEYWDSATASAIAWVRIDTVLGNSSAQNVRMLWGNASAKKTSRPAMVFDTAHGFQGVWHLGESGPNSKADATANGFVGAPVELTGSSDVDGMAGRGLDLDGSSQCVTVLNARNTKLDVQADSFYSVSAWVYLRNVQLDNRVIVSKGSAQFGLMANDRNQWEFYGGLRGYGVDTTTTSAAAINVWTLLTGVRQGKRQYLYVNGAIADSTVSAAGVGVSLSNNYYDLVIGRQSDGESQWFDGMVDEVRVENRVRSAAWIRLCYENQRTGQKFVSVLRVR